MHFLLLILRLMLDRCFRGWNDGLSLAARADGRIEQHHGHPGWWNRWFSRESRASAERRHYGPKVRAGSEPARLRNSRAE